MPQPRADSFKPDSTRLWPSGWRKKKGEAPRPEVIAHAKASIARHRGLDEELAKQVSEYLRVIEILAIHALVIDEFGGTDGPRDLGALEAAVFRPQTSYYDDPISEAAALFESLIQNHPFLDGNKRTALGTANVHLRMNGLELGGTNGASQVHHRPHGAG